MDGETDGLADGSSGAVGEGHEPGLGASGGKAGGSNGDAGPKGKAFKGLVEGDGEKEDEEGWREGDGEGDADEDGVEEDAGFEEEALKEELFLDLVGGERGGGWGVVVLKRLRGRRDGIEIVERGDRVLV